ncbi:MAG: hypothetical protein ABI443_11210 [Chthoniobacterales bacterium]
MISTCPECNSSELYYNESVRVSGIYGPNLLPDLHSFCDPFPLCTVVICAHCGNMRFFVQPKQLEKLTNANGWTKADPDDVHSSLSGLREIPSPPHHPGVESVVPPPPFPEWKP